MRGWSGAAPATHFLFLTQLYRSLSVDLVHQIEELAQCVETFIKRLPQRRDVNGCDSGSPVDTEALAHHLFAANQVRFENQFIRNERNSRLALALQPELLHIAREFGIAGALEDLVIEIMLARSHCPDIKRQRDFERGKQVLQVI